ncbi:FAD-dependent monooxygenase [Actinoplanes solisilvae]|uniref:FAD-dependent monooxygenase n=1 Tax=Actinoplanes solisilvae TaxID=2486853 RepID=UPI0013E3CE34|nr:FAD-dependent monooxygenase [Actinoplanes solisilvae]
MTTLRILIAGGGLAGLATKLALASRGVDADLAERDTTPRDGGTGLYLPANAVRALRDLGLGDELDRRSAPVRRQEIRDRTGALLTGFDLSEIWSEVGESRAIRRSDLHALLGAAAGSSGVRLGAAVTEARADGTVEFSDGSEDRYDVVIGADGIDSAVRRAIFPRTGRKFLDQICWRFLAPTGDASETWVARLGNRGRTFLTVPVGDGQVYCFAAINSASPAAPAGDWRELFADFNVADLLEHAADAYFAPLHEIEGADWVSGRVVLIGDAAHACSPSMAQGGAMALEDALVLADELADGPVPEALDRYRARRSERVAFVLEQNHRRDKARNLPGFVRKAVFRKAGVKIIKGNHAGLLTRP